MLLIGKKEWQELTGHLQALQALVEDCRVRLDAIETASAAAREIVQAGNTQMTAEVARLGKELSEQLMLLDESSRLLLLHTVINELDGQQ